MTIPLNYQKRKNGRLFTSLQNHKEMELSQVQNYIPIYNTFFSLNDTNFNSVNLNHVWFLHDICNKTESDNIVTCKLKNSKTDVMKDSKVFFKMAPLLDPCKYIVGKYNHLNPTLFMLPTLENNVSVHPKLLDRNNCSYVDGFFVFLTSQLLNCKQFIHGVDYYGSFLAIKNHFKLNVADDLDYLIKSDFFNKQKNNLFKIDDYSHLVSGEIIPNLIPIHIHSPDVIPELVIPSIDNEIFENIFAETVVDGPSELIDITYVNPFLEGDDHAQTLRSNSSCSSRTSHTHSAENNDDDDTDNDDTDGDDDDDSNTDDATDGAMDDNDDDSTESSDNSHMSEEETINVTLENFPVQMICMEKCENTFDDLIISNDLTHDEWFSALMQIIMMLITYQKVFSFTHNDLHTNNIMYNTTNIKFLYYQYKKKYYKVPTFGRIYKIIDFGRAIYKFNGHVFCSDSFQIGGDAATQYNTEPYFNDKKPRLEPNFSFDLCRLACSIFDYIVDDFDTMSDLEATNPVVKLIVEWCSDDNHINVLYKNNGIERYPDFKLYKMIARCVHNHTPHAQLERPEFKKFSISKSNLAKDISVMNIDEL